MREGSRRHRGRWGLWASLGSLAAACSAPATATEPTFGPTMSQATAPPPISGGTLLVTRDGRTAVASDPDHDRIWVVDLAQRTVRGQIALNPGDEPGRAAEDGAGHVFVALRRGGALVPVDVASATALPRRAVCAAPRGLAYDGAHDALVVACAGGELVTLPAAGGAATRTLTLERDLRDVVVSGDHVLVSTFRTARLLDVAPDGTVASTLAPPDYNQQRLVTRGRSSSEVTINFQPTVAWRTLALPDGGAVMVHQRSQTGSIVSGTDVYYGTSLGCGACSCSVVHGTVTVLKPGSVPTVSPLIPMATLPVDLALDSTGTHFALVSAANAAVAQVPQVFVMPRDGIDPGDDCAHPAEAIAQPSGQAVAAAYTPQDQLVVQTREPAALFFPADGATVTLSTESRHDTGHEVFHSNSGTFIACASCHPEGGDDGHIWTFADGSPRRTQAVRGGILGTEPFHWNGDVADLSALMTDVFVGRMNGPPLNDAQVSALAHWLDRIPLPVASPPSDPAAVERGRALFADPALQCTSCHSGEHLTDNQTVDVGTSGPLQVPSLRGLAWRAPYMHSGCAATLTERFNPACGGSNHGRTASLSAAQVADLVSYLDTL